MTFEKFLKDFVPQVAYQSKQANLANWILETTGSMDAAELKAQLDTQVRLLFQDSNTYQKLLEWEKQGAQNPIDARQINVLLRAFKQNLLPRASLEEIAQKEAHLAQTYANFRPQLDGQSLSENEIRERLKNEKDPAKRQKVWEASKQIGAVLAPQILELVRLRNQAARSLGYSDYFQMQLVLQEVDPKWLLGVLDALANQSEKAYEQVLGEIVKRQSAQFSLPIAKLGPWAWGDPFCQEDPLDSCELDQLVAGVDIAKAATQFYKDMGIDVTPILQRSDLYERAGKNQHAFCINIDRGEDVRTLNNIQPSIRWLETVLHELGHAIYELGFDPKLPWLLREPPHMIPTEAMALIAGRQAYRPSALAALVGPCNKELMEKAARSLRRRQLIFSRWVLVMTAFESELYRDPTQDLNRLWWQYVEKYQKISAPLDRQGQCDWATKYHLGLAPVYYFSYLLGEMFASAIQEALQQHCGSQELNHPKAGQFLQSKLFAPGNRLSWFDLIQHVTGKMLTPEPWVKEFAT